MSTQKTDLQKYTLLPLKEISVGSTVFPDIIVTTPHKGNVTLKLKQEHSSFFGGVSQTERHVGSIVYELHELEQESIKYLLNKWKSNLTNQE